MARALGQLGKQVKELAVDKLLIWVAAILAGGVVLILVLKELDVFLGDIFGQITGVIGQLITKTVNAIKNAFSGS